ncbi:cytochrome c maturation protein CcmE [Pseudomonadales bacterium]|nr:cytochrome c maturation protein CcmE [Pseudomonadales bacterium]MDB3978490.1 cytochrome c maturation protein CcmE [Pseudomonadales bacterium]
MKPQRRNRLLLILGLVGGLGLALTFVLKALNSNINLFYTPVQVIAGEVPTGARVRAGGMVEAGSIRRSDGSLEVAFMVSDLAGAAFEIRYTGILPDLFREGQGVVATGTLSQDGVFLAEEILAKHDEKYMPPEVAMALDATRQDPLQP